MGFPGPTVPLLVEALAQIGGQQAERHLTSLLLRERYWRREQGDLDWSPATDWVMPALVELGGAELLLRALLNALTDSWPDIRKHAADEFANIAFRATDDEGWTGFDNEPITELHRAAMVDALCLSLNDTDSRVRYSAALALGDLGDVRAIEPLRQRSDDPEIWRPVQEALSKLTQR
ncbi:hypothetical protein GC106_16880 [Kibdelosporangium sp. 4NS15]|uniref:HEAT repeat domain-containing protein n=1 Tax=Kibdelosporangium persicum TaxID=2698649 RepID=A0ABX2EZQ4_9PSEU|nr:HEAT repeat domain-containing protein [Kibdelosporangium persicum]NRN64482.1 hypothetical protein [Kibdelosporangium persicum]